MPDKNPLDLLNLGGLDKIEEKIDKAALSKATTEPTLGNIATLPGTWVGTGFNIIEVPNMNQAKPGPPPPDKFKVILNATSETLIFSPISGDIINRGNAQQDISFLGLHYLQNVSDVNLPAGNNGIHLETGLFLNLVASKDPLQGPTITRLGSIPHGDSILAQGKSFVVDGGGPQFDIADPTPFTIVDGKRVNDTSENYLSILKNTPPPPGISPEIVMNPNLLLSEAIKGQNIIKTVVILLDANPIDGVSNVPASDPVGGITNIPFVNVNANASTVSAIFWIETVQNADGSTFLQLQYTQTVILDFPVFGADPSQVVNIKWPHISVATLLLQP
ncbi:heme-binding protein [Arachidicoccus terrestris]|uniref:heme-binding protein n=1 Tax=Arachidicoccus terrestris TaxID=2875539 RepID=UPI001CC4F147|nr:heme-binding protein [Arachidicoccus terrestris]UAY56183.1 hypothetical protein K9M52_03925 [Arachidicoccus terrestris]